jgi:hypothetical protein
MYRGSRQGYVEEQIARLARFIALTLGLKDIDGDEAAFTAIGEGFEEYCGVSLKLVTILAEDSVRQLFAGTSAQEIFRCYAAAVLLDEFASLLQGRNQFAGAQASWIRSAILLKQAMDADEGYRTDENRSRLHAIDAKLAANGVSLPGEKA